MLLARKGDRVPVEIGDATFYFRPLLMDDKTAIMASLPQGERKPEEMMVFTAGVIQKTLVDVDGIYLADGSAWKPTLVNGSISDSDASDLMNMDLGAHVVTVAGMFLKGVPAEGAVINPMDGKPLPGVVVKKAIASTSK